MKTTTTKIAELNDQCRKSIPNESLRLTIGIFSKESKEIAEIIKLVKKFDVFTEDNDPYGEHDFGIIEYKSQRIFWKIDYFDINLEYGSPDAADPAKTKRVLTIMLDKEY